MSDIGRAYLSGVLMAMVRHLLDNIERCEQHDQWLATKYRAELEDIERVLATSGWGMEDIRAVVCGPVAA